MNDHLNQSRNESESRISSRRLVAMAVQLFVLPLLGACASGLGNQEELTLEQARKMSAEFQKEPFTPPPRTVADVMEKLGPAKPAPAVCAERKSPSKTAAESLMGRSNYTRWWRAQSDISEARYAFYQGDYQRSVRFAEAAAGVMPPAWQDHQAMMYFAVSRYHAYTGDIASARAAYRQGATARNVRYMYWNNTAAMISIRKDRMDAHALVAEAAIAQLQGKYRLGEMRYREIIANYRAALSEYISIELVRLDLADGLAHQGRFAEAESEVRNALKYSYVDSLHTAYYVLQLARIVYAQGRYDDAESLVRRAINMYQVICVPRDSINLALARQLLAEILVARDQWQQALEEFQAIEAAVAPGNEDIFERKFRHNVDWSLAYLNAGETRLAIKRLDDTVNYLHAQFGSRHYSVAEARSLLGIALAENNDYEAALKELREALPVIVAHLRRLNAQKEGLTSRDRRAIEILEGYMALLMDIRGTPLESSYAIDAVAETFALAQTAGRGEVQLALSASSARAAGRDPKLAELARREQDTRRQVSALSERLDFQLSLASDEQDTKTIDALKAQIKKLEELHGLLMEELESAFPDYLEIISPRPITLADAQSALRPGEALLVVYTARQRTYVWTMSARRSATANLVDSGRKELTRMVAMLRTALDPDTSRLDEIPDFDLAEAYSLYLAILEPSKAAWSSARNLIVVAHGPLAQLPLGLLPTAPTRLADPRPPLFSNYRSVPWLASTHAVTVLPAAASLNTLRRFSAGPAERRAFAGFGDPVFDRAPSNGAGTSSEQFVASVSLRGASGAGRLYLARRSAPKTRSATSAELTALPSLPETADELKAIAKTLNADLASDVFLGERANEDAVKAMQLDNRRVIAFATHGLVPGDLNGLTQPALALSAPGPGEQQDGLLTMGEILELHLDADWVVLSACNTGAADGTGAEAVSGLGRAFFYAGARSLLVSNWPVETTSAKALTTSIFERQASDASLSRAEALQRAMLGLIDSGGYVDPQGRTVFSYAHPIFWAPFSLVGDGGGLH